MTQRILNPTYPPPRPNADTLDPAYQDQAAAALYLEAGGGKLVGALRSLHNALDSQAKKLEEFHNTPYTEDHAKLMSVTSETIRLIELQLERWHFLIYPNQRKGG